MAGSGERYEKKIQNKINNNSGLRCERRIDVSGISGSDWEVDAVIYDGNEPKSYLEIKYIGDASNYDTQYRLAFAQMADLRHLNVPGAIIVPEKRNPGKKRDWDSYFATIGCVLIDERMIGDFLDALQEFPTAPETSDPLEDFINDEVWENMGNEPLCFPDQDEPANENVANLREIWRDVNDEDDEK